MDIRYSKEDQRGISKKKNWRLLSRSDRIAGFSGGCLLKVLRWVYVSCVPSSFS